MAAENIDKMFGNTGAGNILKQAVKLIDDYEIEKITVNVGKVKGIVSMTKKR